MDTYEILLNYNAAQDSIKSFNCISIVSSFWLLAEIQVMLL